MPQELSDQFTISEKLQKYDRLYGKWGGNTRITPAGQGIFGGDPAVYEGE